MEVEMLLCLCSNCFSGSTTEFWFCFFFFTMLRQKMFMGWREFKLCWPASGALPASLFLLMKILGIQQCRANIYRRLSRIDFETSSILVFWFGFKVGEGRRRSSRGKLNSMRFLLLEVSWLWFCGICCWFTTLFRHFSS
jgi:hypothetical protein